MKNLASSLFYLFILTSNAQADDINVWFKTFIPSSVGKEIPSVSEKVISTDNFLINCFSTDDRYFSADRDASARLTAWLKLSTEDRSYYDFGGESGVTKEYKCDTGEFVESARASFSEGFTGTLESSNDIERAFKFKVNTANPLIMSAVSPDIDAEISLKETRDASTGAYTYEVSGKVDAFPAFEMYLEHNGILHTIFQINPEDGATPANLFGEANRDVGSTTITLP
ncbi:hypothetical protein SAMN04487962_1482 [Marinobacter segnicrescens]|uniref:Uncharacterized protein n=1 Tax=Marinobacter segnicrescens TaxID=430453 RepID=A0A1I0I8T3_9GAMM|nr:hypothetical protein [Marinobacter segnicrescens]SET92790.1 hypothetical protein SAMN04487962_1482 [Marinobacter segnicrescens]